MTTSLSLTVTQRVQLINGILPKEGNMLEQLSIREIGEKIKVTEEDLKIIGHVLVKDSEGRVIEEKIDPAKEKASGREFEFSESQIQLMKTAVNKLDTDKKITPINLELCIAIKDSAPKKEGE